MSTFPIKVVPSLLAADHGKLTEEAKRIEQAGADALHIDIMDNHFVPNLAFCAQTITAIKRSTNLFIEAHLMIYNPYQHIERFIAAGADLITIHFEATEDVADTLTYIRRGNVKAGLAFNPETSSSFALKYLDQCDMMLFMTVNPGFGGQAFIPAVLEKIHFIRQTCEQLNIGSGGRTVTSEQKSTSSLSLFDIQVDGGINYQTAKQCVDAGANVLAAGTHIFSSLNPQQTIAEFKLLQPTAKT